jgi:hypothetical protein
MIYVNGTISKKQKPLKCPEFLCDDHGHNIFDYMKNKKVEMIICDRRISINFV